MEQIPITVQVKVHTSRIKPRLGLLQNLCFKVNCNSQKIVCIARCQTKKLAGWHQAAKAGLISTSSRSTSNEAHLYHINQWPRNSNSY